MKKMIWICDPCKYHLKCVYIRTFRTLKRVLLEKENWDLAGFL